MAHRFPARNRASPPRSAPAGGSGGAGRRDPRPAQGGPPWAEQATLDSSGARGDERAVSRAAGERPGGNWWSPALAILRNPLYRSSYALIVNTAGTTVVGVAYWAVAAHLYSRENLGRSSALISALMLVSSFTQLNLVNTLPQFLPRTGRRAGRLIFYSYAAAWTAALAVSATYVVVMPQLSQQWAFLGQSELLALAFVLAAVVWGSFALEDAALLSLQRAALVPAENTFYGVAKLLLLVGIASVLPASGIFLSWVLPLVIIVPVINWLIFRRYLRQWPRVREVATVRPREIVRFASLDYVGAVLGQAYVNLPPLLVLSILGAGANGSFAVAWTISAGLALVSGNFATSLLVEGAAAPDRLPELTRGVLGRCLAVTAAGAAVLALGAHPILSFYGHQYASRSSLLLGLLAASTIAQGLVAIAFSLDRLQNRLGRAALTRVVLAVLALGGSWLLMRKLGIDGVGFAWVGANTIVALARSTTIVGAMRRRGRMPAIRGHYDTQRDSPAPVAHPQQKAADQRGEPPSPPPDRWWPFW